MAGFTRVMIDFGQAVAALLVAEVMAKGIPRWLGLVFIALCLLAAYAFEERGRRSAPQGGHMFKFWFGIRYVSSTPMEPSNGHGRTRGGKAVGLFSRSTCQAVTAPGVVERPIAAVALRNKGGNSEPQAGARSRTGGND
jgi:hypothetical protein